ncbi:hypothetical protein J6590_074245 [Homalodisca vitripennis]|nr:hypothetical protein J6590_074245 [Homalodisca vitripennis]
MKSQYHQHYNHDNRPNNSVKERTGVPGGRAMEAAGFRTEVECGLCCIESLVNINQSKGMVESIRNLGRNTYLQA